MSAGFAIRPAVASDAAVIVMLAEEFAEALAALPVPEGVPQIPEPDDVPVTEAILLRDVFAAAPLAHVLLAERDGQAVGYLMYHFGYWPADGGPSLHVVDLFVRGSARGQGAGRKLMQSAGAILKAKGGRRLLWTVWDQNHPAMAFYQRLGARFFAEERLMTWKV